MKETENMKPKLKIIGSDGNAFALLGKASTVAKRNKMNWDLIFKEATSGDYNHVLNTLSKYFEVC